MFNAQSTMTVISGRTEAGTVSEISAKVAFDKATNGQTYNYKTGNVENN